MQKKILMVVEQCNPEWASVPLVGFNFYDQISQLAEVTLVTHQRNKAAMEKVRQDRKIIYIAENKLLTRYFNIASNLANRGVVNWPLYHFLTYPLYADFNRKVYKLLRNEVESNKFDIVHALTPMMPRYPVKLIKACKSTPFLLGPVNGGVPFPKGFSETARKENANLNFIRTIGRLLIPGYATTYRKASLILSGSTYSLNMIKEMFKLPDNKLRLIYENGLPSKFFVTRTHKEHTTDTIKLVFVGRLVPYKGTDMLLEAISKLSATVKSKITLMIVGDGSERLNLENLAQTLEITHLVSFAGWVTHEETLNYYSESDIFCFPSIREFGGAVVLEAMACGLPCIVVNNGGIGEYVTDQTGFRIEPKSRDYIVEQLCEKIELLVSQPQLKDSMSSHAVEHVRSFEWSKKARAITAIYDELLA